jgi:hypothetical protein
MTDYMVKEVTVTGSFKNWDDPGRANPQGISGGSEVAITAVPPDPDLLWTPQEAEVVGFDLRGKIHIMLMADAQMRGVQLPASAHHAMVRYRDKITSLKNGHPTVEYRDADLASPAPSLVQDDIIPDPTEVVTP